MFLSLCRQIPAVSNVEHNAAVASCLPHTSPVTFGQGWTELSDFEKVKKLSVLFFKLFAEWRRSGRGVLAKYAKYGLGASLRVSAGVPEISLSVQFLISCQNQGGGERREVTQGQI